MVWELEGHDLLDEVANVATQQTSPHFYSPLTCEYTSFSHEHLSRSCKLSSFNPFLISS